MMIFLMGELNVSKTSRFYNNLEKSLCLSSLGFFATQQFAKTSSTLKRNTKNIGKKRGSGWNAALTKMNKGIKPSGLHGTPRVFGFVFGRKKEQESKVWTLG